MKNIIPSLAGLCALGLLSATPALGQATDVDCGACIDTGDISSRAVTGGKIAGNAISTDKLKSGAVTTGKIADGSVTADKIAAGAIGFEQIDLSLDWEIQTATDYGLRGMNSGNASLSILERLIGTLGLTCAEANYGRFIGCTQITAGDGTVWPLESIHPEFGFAILFVQFDPWIVVYAAQNQFGEMLIGGPANFTRGTYRDADDVDRLVDDCDSPTLAMTPVLLGATNSRWRQRRQGT